MMLQQKEEYGRRGISLRHFEKDTQIPHFINLDEDPFRSHRFIYLLDRPRTVCKLYIVHLQHKAVLDTSSDFISHLCHWRNV
jgi:hypothetical protein